MSKIDYTEDLIRLHLDGGEPPLTTINVSTMRALLAGLTAGLWSLPQDLDTQVFINEAQIYLDSIDVSKLPNRHFQGNTGPDS